MWAGNTEEELTDREAEEGWQTKGIENVIHNSSNIPGNILMRQMHEGLILEVAHKKQLCILCIDLPTV